MHAHNSTDLISTAVPRYRVRLEYPYRYYRRTPKMFAIIYQAFRTIRTIPSAFCTMRTNSLLLSAPWPFFCTLYLPQHIQSDWDATPHTHWRLLHTVANAMQLGRYLIHAFACAPYRSKRSAIGDATPYTHLLALHSVANAVQLGRYPIHALACAPFCTNRD